MNRSIFTNGTAIAALMLLMVSSNLQAQESTVFAGDFSTSTGFSTTQLNDKHEENGKRTVQTFSFMDEEYTGELQLTIRENEKTNGADNKPGVLELSFDTLPEENTFCGFAYLGTVANLMKVPALDGEFEEAVLDQVEVSFQYKAANKNRDDIGLDVNCRFEPESESSYEARIDFGKLQATGEWQEFKMKLAAGTNKAAFVGVVKGLTDRTFKIAWGQEGPITNYQAGDTLLIDDVKIKVLK